MYFTIDLMFAFLYANEGDIVSDTSHKITRKMQIQFRLKGKEKRRFLLAHLEHDILVQYRIFNKITYFKNMKTPETISCHIVKS